MNNERLHYHLPYTPDHDDFAECFERHDEIVRWKERYFDTFNFDLARQNHWLRHRKFANGYIQWTLMHTIEKDDGGLLIRYIHDESAIVKRLEELLQVSHTPKCSPLGYCQNCICCYDVSRITFKRADRFYMDAIKLRSGQHFTVSTISQELTFARDSKLRNDAFDCSKLRIALAFDDAQTSLWRTCWPTQDQEEAKQVFRGAMHCPKWFEEVNIISDDSYNGDDSDICDGDDAIEVLPSNDDKELMNTLEEVTTPINADLINAENRLKDLVGTASSREVDEFYEELKLLAVDLVNHGMDQIGLFLLFAQEFVKTDDECSLHDSLYHVLELIWYGYPQIFGKGLPSMSREDVPLDFPCRKKIIDD